MRRRPSLFRLRRICWQIGVNTSIVKVRWIYIEITELHRRYKVSLLKNLVAVGCLVAGMSATASAQCPPWRPCGPGNPFGGNLLFRQGAAGVDYRPACANHDARLANSCNSRRACDQQYLADMNAACACSDNPEKCMRKARMQYVGVRLFGGLFRRGAP